jgi:hypothetical protein
VGKKMNRGKCVFFTLGVLLAGCIPSLHQLYTDKDVVYDPKLIGTWKDPNSLDRWQFAAASEPNCYTLTYTDEKKKNGSFIVHLVKLDKMLFLDVFPKDANQPYSDYYKLHLYPVHTFIKVEQIEPTLQMRFMDVDKFTKRLEKEPALIKHEVVENRADNYPKIVLTASTKELQDFMRKHANDEGIFSKPIILNRVVPIESGAVADSNSR